MTILVNLERGSTEHVCGILESENTVKTLVEVLTGSNLNVVKTVILKDNNLCILSVHINLYVCGEALVGIFEPLEEIAVLKREDSVRITVVVDLS
jgi:hypothetical protein